MFIEINLQPGFDILDAGVGLYTIKNDWRQISCLQFVDEAVIETNAGNSTIGDQQCGLVTPALLMKPGNSFTLPGPSESEGMGTLSRLTTRLIMKCAVRYKSFCISVYLFLEFHRIKVRGQ